MYIPTELQEWYLKYFELFRDHAPKHMVEYGGYQLGKPTGMASSLESIIAFANKVNSYNSNDPRYNAWIVNAGAGASSWMLRKLFSSRVICIDPDDQYLKVVEEICRLGNLDTVSFFDGGMERLKRFTCAPSHTYYDYGNIERMPNLQSAIDITQGVIYVDDTDTRADCAEYRAFTYQKAKEQNLIIEDCLDAKDEYGRWGVFLTKQS